MELQKAMPWTLPGIIIRPKATFQAIITNPSWVLPLLATIILKFAFTVTFFNPVNTMAGRGITLLIMALSTIVPAAFCSLVFLLGFYLLAKDASFKNLFSIFAHLFFLYNLITVVLSGIILTLAGESGAVDRWNPIASNLGIFVDREHHLALHQLASSIDIITFYHLYLLMVGLAIIKRVPFKVSALMVVVCWGMYTSVLVGIKAVASSF